MPGSLAWSVMPAAMSRSLMLVCWECQRSSANASVFVESVGDHQGALGLFDRGPGFGGLLDRRRVAAVRSRCRDR